MRRALKLVSRDEQFSPNPRRECSLFGLTIIEKPATRIFIGGQARLNRYIVMPKRSNFFQKILAWVLLKCRYVDCAKKSSTAFVYVTHFDANQVFNW